MSRIGKLPISIPEKVEVKVLKSSVDVKGPKGALHFDLPEQITVAVDGANVLVSRQGEDRVAKSMHGLCRNQIANMVFGVTKGFAKELEINGVGYRAAIKGQELQLSLGYSHPIIYPLPTGIGAELDGKGVKLTLSGIDKQLLGNTAAKVRSFRPPEPYRGKGIKYADEIIKRKEGKSAGK